MESGEASGEGRKEGAILCLHYFFGSTEKQDVKDLPGLPRNRDPGEGELEVCECRDGESRGVVG